MGEEFKVKYEAKQKINLIQKILRNQKVSKDLESRESVGWPSVPDLNCNSAS